jgi:hypothetical protein
MEDSFKILNGSDNVYLYEIVEKKLSLFATPNGRIPIGQKENTRIIALSKNGRNYYPSDDRLNPIRIRLGSKIVFRFKYK